VATVMPLWVEATPSLDESRLHGRLYLSLNRIREAFTMIVSIKVGCTAWCAESIWASLTDS